jgi:hypothetical protein
MSNVQVGVALGISPLTNADQVQIPSTVKLGHWTFFIGHWIFPKGMIFFAT